MTLGRFVLCGCLCCVAACRRSGSVGQEQRLATEQPPAPSRRHVDEGVPATPTVDQPDDDPRPYRPSIAARPPEATTCATSADCAVAQVYDDGPGGSCCPLCERFAALNRTWSAQYPRCQSNGCAVSCARSTAANAVAVCVAGRCYLDYPPLANTCRTNSDCQTLPRLSPSVNAQGCRLACGEHVAVNRFEAGRTHSLWRNESATGTCTPGCALPRPDAHCVAGHCAVMDASPLHVRSLRPSEVTVDGPIPVVAVQNELRARWPEFERCQEPPRRVPPQTATSVRIDLRVGTDGAVVRAETGEFGERLPSLAQCFETSARGWRFPAPTGARGARVQFIVSLEFGP